MRQLGLDNATKHLTTPGMRGEGEEDDMELSSEEVTRFRALTARANYLAQDRSDIQFAVKELCRKASDPRLGDWKAL